MVCYHGRVPRGYRGEFLGAYRDAEGGFMG
jgi:hypothetical protein